MAKTEAQLRAQMGRIAQYGKRRAARQAAAAAASATAKAAAPAAAAAGQVVNKGLMSGLRAGVSRMGIPGLVLGTLAYPVIERLIYGSREQQMRDQFELQKKLEQEEMAKMGGVSPMGDMGGVAGGMMPQQERSMYDLLEEERETRNDLDYANRVNRINRSLGGSDDELNSLLAGQEARLRQIQAPRQLTPYEIMGIIGG
jgi:hypothetical protein